MSSNGQEDDMNAQQVQGSHQPAAEGNLNDSMAYDADDFDKSSQPKTTSNEPRDSLQNPGQDKQQENASAAPEDNGKQAQNR